MFGYREINIRIWRGFISNCINRPMALFMSESGVWCWWKGVAGAPPHPPRPELVTAPFIFVQLQPRIVVAAPIFRIVSRLSLTHTVVININSRNMVWLFSPFSGD